MHNRKYPENHQSLSIFTYLNNGNHTLPFSNGCSERHSLFINANCLYITMYVHCIILCYYNYYRKQYQCIVHIHLGTLYSLAHTYKLTHTMHTYIHAHVHSNKGHILLPLLYVLLISSSETVM